MPQFCQSCVELLRVPVIKVYYELCMILLVLLTHAIVIDHGVAMSGIAGEVPYIFHISQYILNKGDRSFRFVYIGSFWRIHFDQKQRLIRCGKETHTNFGKERKAAYKNQEGSRNHEVPSLHGSP